MRTQVNSILILSVFILSTAALDENFQRFEAASRAISSFIDIMKEKYYIEFEILVLGDDKNLMKIANKVISYSSVPLTLNVDLDVNEKTEVYNVSSLKSVILIYGLHEPRFEFENPIFYQSIAYKPVFFLGHNSYAVEEDNYFMNGEFEPERFFALSHTKDGNISLVGNDIMSSQNGYKCSSTIKSLNKFFVKERKWNSSDFVPFIQDFHGCALKICGVSIPFDLAYFYDTPKGPAGFSMYFMYPFKKKFKIGSYLFIDFGLKKNIASAEKYVNSTPKMCDIFLVYNLHLLYNLGDNYIKKSNDFAETYPVYYAQYSFIVTKGLSYSPMEKLFLPFDRETWIMIMISFAIGFGTIFVVYRCNRFVQRFVFGTFIRDPSLNLTSIFFGIGVTRLPGRNFARFLFMIFTLYCLIIRTAYQGKMFEFLNKNIRKPTAKTVDDIVNWKLPLLRVSYGENFTYKENFKKFSTIKVSYDKMNEFFDNQMCYGNDTFAIEENKDLIYIGNSKIHKNYDYRKLGADVSNNVNSYSKLFAVVEGTRSFSVSWMMKRSSFLIDSFNKFLMECEQHGIHEKIYNDMFYHNVPSASSDVDKKKLTLDVLSAGFTVWIFSVLIACIVFVIEHIVAFFTRKP